MQKMQQWLTKMLEMQSKRQNFKSWLESKIQIIKNQSNNRMKYFTLIMTLGFLSILVTNLQGQEVEIFKVVQDMPHFPSCDNDNLHLRDECTKNKLSKYLSKNMVYSDSARMMGVDGFVVVQFIIDSTGNVRDVKVLRDMPYGCGKGVEKLIWSIGEKLEKWVPAQHNNRNVDLLWTQKVPLFVNGQSTPSNENIVNEPDTKPVLISCALHSHNDKSECTKDKLAMLIYPNLRYPAKARENSIEGTVQVEFVIDKSGKMSNIKITKSLSPECDEAVIHALDKVAKKGEIWMPAIHKGHNVNSLYTLPVNFFLEEPKRRK
jgi:TonB family protein